MDTLLRVERLKESPPDHGGPEEWEAAGEFWAEVRPLSAGRRLEAQRIGGQVTHEVVSRRREDLTLRHRFVDRAGRVYRVEGVTFAHGRRDMTVLAVEEAR